MRGVGYSGLGEGGEVYAFTDKMAAGSGRGNGCARRPRLSPQFWLAIVGSPLLPAPHGLGLGTQLQASVRRRGADGLDGGLMVWRFNWGAAAGRRAGMGAPRFPAAARICARAVQHAVLPAVAGATVRCRCDGGGAAASLPFRLGLELHQPRRQLQLLASAALPIIVVNGFGLAAHNLGDERRPKDDGGAQKALGAQPLAQHGPGKGCGGIVTVGVGR